MPARAPDGYPARVTRAMWAWVPDEAPPDPDALARFAARQRVREAFVSVPWSGPTPATHACVAALRGAGVRVAALGGDPAWVEGGAAAAWATRATSSGRFDGVHLDIEPWSRADWPGSEQRLLDGLERAVRDVGASTRLPVEVDLAPWLAIEHPRAFTAIARRARGIALMAYRDRAGDILAVSATARDLLARADRPYRIGVETGPVRVPAPAARETFADDGGAVLERELAEVARRLASDARFAGVAVHDAAAWQSLGP